MINATNYLAEYILVSRMKILSTIEKELIKIPKNKVL